ncbi:MAG: DUF349 domain-containing protein [Actinobacteria bacterium]|nr:DUF349 domain-containing protein [Actinomycetota bacterium]MBU1609740.1 DUF349 domain-containing protein [Actinomycetota bacterium]MBU2316245.1 DUF349 domain-containing protein [Actinomycetota bacterium]MBU2385721.1 DUF349 domain-containing protein [Actinomycetota bacterium]
MTDNGVTQWGRVDETGTVFVTDRGTERAVGQYPDGSPEEALAYFTRKYAELEGQVRLLEQRARGGAPAADVAKTVTSLTEALESAAAVGDLEALRTRVSALTVAVEKLTEEQKAEEAAALEAALVERTQIVVAAEALAAKDPQSVQWKQATAELDALFSRWKEHQQTGPRVPKKQADELWKRFRAARTTVESHRRAFFAALDAEHKDARQRKQDLVARAEALASQGTAGIPAYRRLLDEWKQAGRAGKKVDDALWDSFKAAGDVLYAAKAEVDARENEEFAGNLEAKLAILEEAKPLLTATDRVAARNTLTNIQKRWDAIGKVPRDQMKSVEDRLRAIETAVRKLEDDHWNTSNPEKKARSEGLAAQLESAIAGLEADLAAARAAKDEAKVAELTEALEARRAWLAAVDA